MRFSNVFFLINRNTYSTHGNSLKQHEPNIFIIPNYIDKKKEYDLCRRNSLWLKQIRYLGQYKKVRL